MATKTSPAHRKSPRKPKSFQREPKPTPILLDGYNFVSGRRVELTALMRGNKALCDECGDSATWYVEETVPSFIVENFPRPEHWYWCGICSSPTYHKGDPTPAHLKPLGD